MDSSLSFPAAVKFVCHEIDPVEAPRDFRNFVRLCDESISGGNGGDDKETLASGRRGLFLKRRSEFLAEKGESMAIRWWRATRSWILPV